MGAAVRQAERSQAGQQRQHSRLEGSTGTPCVFPAPSCSQAAVWIQEARVQAGELAGPPVPPSRFWLQGSHTGLRQIWGPPSLSPGLPGPAQKQKDTSASDNEWFILFRGPGGEEQRGPPVSPLQQALPTHMLPAGAQAPASGAQRRCTWKPEKNNRGVGHCDSSRDKNHREGVLG